MAITTVGETDRDLQHTRSSLLFGITLWFLHLNVVYALASVGCYRGWFSFSVGPLSGLQVVEILITLVTIPLLLLMIYAPWRAWRRFQTTAPRSNPHLLHDTEEDRVALIAFIVMLLNSAFLLFVVASVVPILGLSACRQS
jgi:hypothetical protein